MTGAWFGLFVGLLLSFIGSSPGGALLSIPIAMLLGAAFWMLFGIVTYAAQRGKRDFTSTSQVLASNYDVIVAREASADARRLLQNLPMAQQPQARPAQVPYQAPNQNQQPPAPPRPEGWTDPYAAPSTPTNASAPSAPSAPSNATGNPAEPQVPKLEGVSNTPPGSYSDLPDGRPQYGIRVQPDAAPSPDATPSETPTQPQAEQEPKQN